MNPIPPEGAASASSPTAGPDGPQPDGAEAELSPATEVKPDVDPLPRRIRRRTQASSKPDPRPTDDGMLDRVLDRLREM